MEYDLCVQWLTRLHQSLLQPEQSQTAHQPEGQHRSTLLHVHHHSLPAAAVLTYQFTLKDIHNILQNETHV